MNKLKNSYIDKMIEKKVTKKELSFILLLAKYQDVNGIVYSVYYKDVCSALDISVQKYYDIIESLKKKDLIRSKKLNPADLVIRFVDNDFSDGKYKNYLNVASKDFQNGRFRRLKAGAQLLYLYSQRFISGKHMFVQNFYDEFCKTFNVVHKTMQLYVQSLKENKFLFISKKRNKAYHYEMMMKSSTVLNVKDVPNEKRLLRCNIIKLIETNFKKYIVPGELTFDGYNKVLTDIAELAETKRAEKHKKFIPLLVEAVKKSIYHQKEEKKEADKIRINAALVNRCLTDLLEEDVLDPYHNYCII